VLRAIEAARQGLTIEELHELLGRPCTSRTLFSAAEQRTLACLSLVSERGRWMVVRVKGDTFACPVRPSEVLALTLASQLLEPLGEGALVASLRDLCGRITARLTPKGRAYAAELSSNAVGMHLAPATPAQGNLTTIIQEALDLGQCLRIRHASPGKLARIRVVEPHGLLMKSGRPYLVARCREAGDVRDFALGRIEHAEILDDIFDADPDFDLAEYANQSFGVFRGPSHQYAIDLHPDVAHVARERIFHHSQRVTPASEGWTRLTFESAGLPEVAAWVAGYGGYAVAIAPAELVDAVKELHEQGLERMGRRK
jgi:predicted DNA-binding transcriptional regulator YafY